MINPRSLHFRLIIWHTLLLAAVVLAFGCYMYLGMRHYLVSSLETTLARRAEQIAGSLVSRVPQESDAWLKEQIHILYAPEQNNRFIRVTDGGGAIIYASGTPKDGSFSPEDVALPKAHVPATRAEATPQNNLLYIATAPLALSDGRHYDIEVGASDLYIQNTLRGLLATLLLGFPALVALAATGGYYLVERSLSSVSDVMRAAEEISLHKLSSRLPIVPTGGKLEQLSLALNRMIGRLEESFRHVSRFTADASHELRTPLAVMRAELEWIVQQPHLPEDVRQQVGSVFEEAERLTRITEGLLAIARLEAGEARMEEATFNLGELAVSTADQLRLLADEKHIGLAATAAQDLYVHGDAARIKQVIVNLLDNAIKYTSEGGTIQVRVSGHDAAARLEVEDSGIGIRQEHLPHIFERFYRTDRARSRGVGGAGLGLSIVRSICQAHGGSVEIESSEGRGTRVIVTLPLAETQEQTA